MDLYKQCLEYSTPSFHLRLVRTEDAKSLLDCYSDCEVASRANSDSCTSNFYYTTEEQMEKCIRFWLEEYQKGYYVRFAIIPQKGIPQLEKDADRAIGTMEISGGKTGVLRLDIASRYEQECYIEELLRLVVLELIPDFQVESLKVKAVNIPERIPILEKYGFLPSETFRPGMGYYERSKIQFFDASKGLAYCGLACCVCSENKDCAGCRNHGCRGKDWCKSYVCCKGGGKSGCWECGEYPCGYPMLDKPRVRAFIEYMKKYGEQDLIAALGRNEKAGVLYHYPRELIGDYDQFQTQEDLFRFLRREYE